MKTVIEMARAAGCHDNGEEFRFVELRYLERFAELVRADEREKYKWDIHSCGPTCERYACVATREAIAAERAEVERLRSLCDEMLSELYVYRASEYLKDVTAAIRARRNA